MGSSTISLGLGLGGGKSATSSGTSGGGGGFANEYSVSFDGTDDYLEIPQGAFDLGTGSWTFSFWFKADALTTTSQTLFIVEGDGRSPSARLGLFARANALVISDWWNTNITYTATISDGTWYHIVCRKEGSGNAAISLFVNGTKRASGYLSTTSDFGDDQATTKVGDDQTATYPFDGKIDEFAFWNSALSDGGVSVGSPASGDIANIYNGGVPNDIGTNGLNLNPVGWWRMGDNDGGTGNTVTDQGNGENNGTLKNIASPNGFVTDVPS